MLSLAKYIDDGKFEGSYGPFVIILGSGFHKQALGSRESILTGWKPLLKSIAPDSTANTGNYILDFETLITQETSKQNMMQAYKIEKKLLRELSVNIEREQKQVLVKYAKKYPMGIFNSDLVSDVISLNFDLVPELLFGSKITKAREIKDKDSGRRLISTRHRKIKQITFWHPHGDIGKPESFMLGLRKYGNQIHECEHLRKRFKENEKAFNINYEPSWYDKLVKQPVLILGASLSPSLEWDIWFALVNRMRNFAKLRRKSDQHAIFKMTEQRESKNNQCDNLFSEILTPLSYEKQWQFIEQLFNRGLNKR